MAHRSMLRLLTLVLVSATLAPVPSLAEKPVKKKRYCGLSETQPVFVCAGAGTVRTAEAMALSKAGRVGLYGFELTGPSAPVNGAASGPVVAAACLMITTRRADAVFCDVPITLTIDPLLRTATFKGSWVERRLGLGRVTVDVTFDAGQEELIPGVSPFQGTDGDCRLAWSGATTPVAYRMAAAGGTVTFQKTLGRVAMSGAGGAISQHVSAGSTITSPTGCGTAREPRDAGGSFWCMGAEVPETAFGCAGGDLSRGAAVTMRNRLVRVSVAGTETLSAYPAIIDDPTGVPPAAPAEDDGLCVEIRGAQFGIGMCSFGEGDGDIAIDPLLRTASIKGSIGSFFDFEDFDGFDGPIGPLRPGFGRIDIDLTLTASGPMQAGGGPSVMNWSSCSFGDAAVSNEATGTAAAATGSVKFQKLYGKFVGTQSKPLDAAMWSKATVNSFYETVIPC